jgi:pentafunctional AROM polypeptide
LKETSFDFVKRQLSLIRRSVPGLPIIFTVRTLSQGGRFSNEKVSDMFDLLEMGVKWGCEFVDVEILDVMDTYYETRLSALLSRKRNSHIIARYVFFSL